MKKDTLKLIRLIYSIILGLSVVAAGICLMAACISIYRSGGEQIYTAQKVQEAFAPISGPVYLCLVLILGSMLLHLLLPLETQKKKAEKNHAVILARLLEKRDVDTCDPALREQILHQRKMRKQNKVLSLLLFAAGSIAFLVYGTNPANFHQSEINTSMAKAVLLLGSLLVIPFIFGVFTAYHSRRSLQKECDLVKQIPTGEYKPAEPATSCSSKVTALRWVVLGVAAVILVYGFFAGGTADVLTKAINICTECVGLG